MSAVPVEPARGRAEGRRPIARAIRRASCRCWRWTGGGSPRASRSSTGSTRPVPSRRCVPGRCRRPRPCPGAGAGRRLRHPSAQQSARAEAARRRSASTQEARDDWYRHWVARRASPRWRRWPRRAPAASCSATRRRSPTSAWCRRCTMPAASRCRSTPIRPWSAPTPRRAALEAFAAAHPDRVAPARRERLRRAPKQEEMRWDASTRSPGAWPRPMRLSTVEIPSMQDKVSAEEWKIRVDLAAAYRLVAHYGWDDLIFTHLSARVPGPEHHFLLNPYQSDVRGGDRLQPGQGRHERQSGRADAVHHQRRPASPSIRRCTWRARTPMR